MVDEIPYTPPGAPAAPVSITPATTSAPAPTEFQQGTVTPAAPAAIGVSSATPSAPTAIGSSAATPVVPDGLDTGAPPAASDPATTKMDKVSAGDADELLGTTASGNAKRLGIFKSTIQGLLTKVQAFVAGTAGRIVALDASGNAYPTSWTAGSLEEQFAAKVDVPTMNRPDAGVEVLATVNTDGALSASSVDAAKVFSSSGMDSSWLGRLICWNGVDGQLFNTGINYLAVSDVISGWYTVQTKANGALRKDTRQTLTIDERIQCQNNLGRWYVTRNLVGWEDPTVVNATNGIWKQYLSFTVAAGATGSVKFAGFAKLMQGHLGIATGTAFNPSKRFRLRHVVSTNSLAFGCLYWLGTMPTTTDPGAPDTAGVGFEVRSGLTTTTERECRLHVRTAAGVVTSSSWTLIKTVQGANIGPTYMAVMELVCIEDGYVYLMANNTNVGQLAISSFSGDPDFGFVIKSTGASSVQLNTFASTTTLEA